jgi:hypothetical protein
MIVKARILIETNTWISQSKDPVGRSFEVYNMSILPPNTMYQILQLYPPVLPTGNQL